MKFVFSSKLDSLSIGAFRRLELWREGNRAVLEIFRMPEYGKHEELFTTLKTHVGRLYFCGNTLHWEDSSRHFSAGSRDIRFYNKDVMLGSSSHCTLQVTTEEIKLYNIATDQTYVVKAGESDWLDVR